ncbi:MAG TPA: hypothetical protein VHY20_03110, partial [Pirellulales bacterium]|nr:hypothetical protein [Pirellulales bacterium]
MTIQQGFFLVQRATQPDSNMGVVLRGFTRPAQSDREIFGILTDFSAKEGSWLPTGLLWAASSFRYPGAIEPGTMIQLQELSRLDDWWSLGYVKKILGQRAVVGREPPDDRASVWSNMILAHSADARCR